MTLFFFSGPLMLDLEVMALFLLGALVLIPEVMAPFSFWGPCSEVRGRRNQQSYTSPAGRLVLRMEP